MKYVVTCRRCHGSRNIEYYTHNSVEVQQHEYSCDKVGQEAKINLSKTCPPRLKEWKCSRDKEENQSICKNHVDQSTPAREARLSAAPNAY
jgi:hypothetical protein